MSASLPRRIFAIVFAGTPARSAIVTTSCVHGPQSAPSAPTIFTA
jgi:hypothetical protein